MGIHGRKKDEFVRRELDHVVTDVTSQSEPGCHGNRSKRKRTRVVVSMGNRKTWDGQGPRKKDIDSNKLKTSECIIDEKALEKNEKEDLDSFLSKENADVVKYLLKELKEKDQADKHGKDQKNVDLAKKATFEKEKTVLGQRETFDKKQLKEEDWNVDEKKNRIKKEAKANKGIESEPERSSKVKNDEIEAETLKLRIEAHKAKVKEEEFKREREVFAEIQAKIAENDYSCRKLVVDMSQTCPNLDKVHSKINTYLDVNDNRLVNDSDDEDETSPKMCQDPLYHDSVKIKNCQEWEPTYMNLNLETSDPFQSCSLNTDQVAGELDHEDGQYSSEPVEHSWPSSQISDPGHQSGLDKHKSSYQGAFPSHQGLASPQLVYLITRGYPNPKVEKLSYCDGQPLVQHLQSVIKSSTKSLLHEEEKELYHTDETENKYKPEEKNGKDKESNKSKSEAGDSDDNDIEKIESEEDVESEYKYHPEESKGSQYGRKIVEYNDDDDTDNEIEDEYNNEESNGTEDGKESHKQKTGAVDDDAEDFEKEDVDESSLKEESMCEIIDAEEKDLDTEKDITIHDNDDSDDKRCVDMNVIDRGNPNIPVEIIENTFTKKDCTPDNDKLKFTDSKELLTSSACKTIRHRLKKETRGRRIKKLQGSDDSLPQVNLYKVREKNLKAVPRQKANRPSKSAMVFKDRKGPNYKQESRMDIYIPEKLRGRRHMWRGKKCGRQCSGNGKAGGRGGGINNGGGSGQHHDKRGGNSNRQEQDNGDDTGSQDGRDEEDKNKWNSGTPTQDMADVNIPPNEYKGPRKKHCDMKDLEWAIWLGQLSSEIKDTGPNISVENTAVSACVSKCLMKPECITADMISCNVCNTVHSMLKHYADCVSLYSECSLCMQIFSLICSHIGDCLNNNGCGGRLCVSVMHHLSGESIVLHMKQLWFRVRKKLARIIGGNDISVEPVSDGVRSRASRPSSSIISMQPSLASIPEAAVAPSVSSSRSGSRVLSRKVSNLAGVSEQTEQQEPKTPASAGIQSHESVVYQRELEVSVPHAEHGPSSLVSDPPSSGPYEGNRLISLPIGPPNKGEVYYPSFTDKPTKKKGIGEVLYRGKELLMNVAGTWSHYKLLFQRNGCLDRHYREEGIILTEFKQKLQIEGLRYAQNFQWLKVSPLGNGMSGKCHLAKDFNTDFQFCVKEIHISNYEKEEIELWSELDHPYIVQLYGAIRHGEKVYIFQEFIQGGCLTEAINEQKQLNRRLSQRTALRILQQLLQALVYIKSKHILHEDIKADNILLHKHKGKVAIKLADFGLARRCTHTVRKGTKPIGTQTQWSPQKAEGTGYGPCAEVWAAVCVLVHILSGQPPWIRRFENSKTLIFVIVKSSPPLEDIPKNILPDIRDLMERGFTLGREQRPTAEQLLIHRAFHILDETSGFVSNAFSMLESTLSTATNKIDPRDEEILEIYQTLNTANKSVKPPASISVYPVFNQVPDQNNGPQEHNPTPPQGMSAQGTGPMQAERNVDPRSHFQNFISDSEPLQILSNIPPGRALTLYEPGESTIGSNNNAKSESEEFLDIESALCQGLPNFDELDIHEFLPEEMNSEDDQEELEEKEKFFQEFDLEKAIEELALNSEKSNVLPTVIDFVGSNNNSFQTLDKVSEEEKANDSINIENEDDLFRSDPGLSPVAVTQQSNEANLTPQQSHDTAGTFSHQGLPNPGLARQELQWDEHFLHQSTLQTQMSSTSGSPRLGMNRTRLQTENQSHFGVIPGNQGSQSLEPHHYQGTRPNIYQRHQSFLQDVASLPHGNRLPDPAYRPGNSKASADTGNQPYHVSSSGKLNRSTSHNRPNVSPSQHHHLATSAERAGVQLNSPEAVESKKRRKEPVFESPALVQGLVPSVNPQTARHHHPERQQVKEGMDALNERRKHQIQNSAADTVLQQRNEVMQRTPLHIDVTRAQLAPTMMAPDIAQTAPVTHTVNTHLAPQRSQSEIAPQSGHRGNRAGLASPLSESSSKSRSQFDVQEEAFREFQDDVLSQHSEHVFELYDTEDHLDAEVNLDDEHFIEAARESLAYMLNEQEDQLIKVEIVSDANGKKMVMKFPLRYKNHNWQEIIQDNFTNDMLHNHFGLMRFTFRCEDDSLVDLTGILGESAVTLRATDADMTDTWFVEGGMFRH